MKACGLIVEYNPFHNGHVYHLQQSKQTTNAECMIAVMSGSFLQRGEPAIIDKYHRTKAALKTGVDIVLELPYPFAVQSSHLFATGAVLTLAEIGVDSICFGSESGNIQPFIDGYNTLHQYNQKFKNILSEELSKGVSYPTASTIAYQEIGLSSDEVDLSKPNNILGFSYVQAVLDHQLEITPFTIQRTNNNYHDKEINSSIASATSIRNQLLNDQHTRNIENSIPSETHSQLIAYRERVGKWHHWEEYFPFIQYRVLTMSTDELASIEGVVEGLEHRLKQTIKKATTFYDWINTIKTKRYTWTRLQRICVHLLTNTKKQEMEKIINNPTIPYIRLLGANNKGQSYLNYVKKDLNKPLVSKFHRNQHTLLSMEERATYAYYSILNPKERQILHKQELQAPIILQN